MTICAKISANLQINCEYPLMGGVKDTLILINYDDIEGVTRNALNKNIIEGITLVSETHAYLFEGKNNSIEGESKLIKTRYSDNYEHQITCKVFLNDPVAKAQLEKIVLGKVVAIVYNNHINDTGDTAFEIYGLGLGLVGSELTRIAGDPETQGAWNLVLKTPEQVKESSTPTTFFLTDYATTKTLVEELLVVGVNYCAEYQAIYDQDVDKANSLDAGRQNTFVETLVNSGEWAILDEIILLARHNSGDSLRRLKHPTSVATVHGASPPVFTPYEGYQGTGAGYVDTGFNLSTHGVNYTLNDASEGGYIRNNVAEAGYAWGSRVSTNYSSFQPRSAANSSWYYINAATSEGVANSDSRGLYVITRINANLNYYYKNGTPTSGTDVSTAIPNTNVFLFCYNNNGTPTSYGTNQLAIWFAGKGLTQTNVNNIMNALETYLDSYGKGVIA